MTTTQKYPEAPLPENESVAATADRLPVAIQKLIQATPKKDWPKIRAFFVETEEEGELVEMLPDVNRVMTSCPGKLIGRVGKREITWEQMTRGYHELHDAIHGVRQALYALIHLAGGKDARSSNSEGKGGKPGESPSADLDSPPEASRADDRTAPALGAIPAEKVPCAIRPGKH